METMTVPNHFMQKFLYRIGGNSFVWESDDYNHTGCWSFCDNFNLQEILFWEQILYVRLVKEFAECWPYLKQKNQLAEIRFKLYFSISQISSFARPFRWTLK